MMTRNWIMIANHGYWILSVVGTADPWWMTVIKLLLCKLFIIFRSPVRKYSTIIMSTHQWLSGFVVGVSVDKHFTPPATPKTIQ